MEKKFFKPGISKSVDLHITKSNGQPVFDYSTQEIISKISSVFHIAYANSMTFSNITKKDSFGNPIKDENGNVVKIRPFYTYCIAKPSKEMYDKWGLYNGILVVIKLRNEFDENRDFDAIDKIYKQGLQYNHSLDRLLTIFVSENESINEKIKKTRLLNDSERKVILPFPKAELNKGHFRGIIEEKLVEFFTQRDLFGFSSPLSTSNYFYGRENIINDLIDSHRNNQMSGIFGLRKVGKTSILNAFIKRTESDNLSTMIDCQDTSVYNRTWNELLEFISDLTVDRFKEVYSDKLELITSAFIDNNIQDDFTPKNASISFEKNLKFLKETFEVHNLTLIFDEIEDISYGLSIDESWKNGKNYLPFWKAIRSIYQRNHELFNIIVSGVNPFSLEIQEINETQNPLFSAIKIHWVPNFSEEETHYMVNDISKYMGIRFKPSIINDIYDQFGGHPFMVRQACSKVHQILISENRSRPYVLEKIFYNDRKDEIYEANKNHISTVMQIFNNRYPDEYHVLKLLSAGVHEEARKELEKNPNIINHLKNYNIVEEYDGRLNIKLESIKSFFGTEIIGFQKGFEERNKEVYDLISTFEVKYRKFLKQNLINSFGNIDSKEKILICLKGNRREEFENLSVDELLDSKNSPLYLLELNLIFTKQWKIFENYFDEQNNYVRIKLNEINKIRTHPAHSKELQFDDSDYKSCTNWILHFTEVFENNTI
jgi:hypothetical protein